MGRHYTQLDIEDRCELARLHAQGRSLRQIAAALDRAPATIARELKRNTARLVASVDRRPVPARAGHDDHRPRDDLPLYLCPDHPHESRPRLAPLPPPCQVAPGLAGAPRRPRGHPHPPPAAPGRTPGQRHRPPDPRPLGSRSAALPHLRPKGGVENAIGRRRRGLPRQTDLATLTDKRFTELLQLYNNTPRKCLDYRDPGGSVLEPRVALQM